MPTRSSATTEDGNVLVLALAVGVTVALILAGLLTVTTSHDGAAVDRSQRAQARWAAEAGIGKALEAMHARRRTGFTTLLLGPDGQGSTPDDGILPGHKTSFGVCDLRVRFENDKIDGDSYRDKNLRLVIVATGQAGQAQETIRAYAEVEDAFRPMQGVLAGHDLTVEGTPDVEGAAGDVHANGNLTVAGGAEVVGDASATGTVTAKPGTVKGATRPFAAPVAIPLLDPADFRSLATHILSPDGKVRDAAGKVLADANLVAYKGWKYAILSKLWTFSGEAAVDGTFYIEGDAEIAGSGSKASERGVWTATFIATGSIALSSKPDLRAHTYGVMVLAGTDLVISGSPNLGTTSKGVAGTPGLVYAVEQFRVEGQTAKINGVLVGATSRQKGLGVVTNRLAGTAAASYDGDLAVATGKGRQTKVLYWERTTTDAAR
jgi:hypothetical protein